MHAAVFLDKDGTLVDDVPYNVDPRHMVLSSGAADALGRLRAAGYRLVVVSNQSGVARGYFDERALVVVERHLRALLRAQGVQLDGFYYCPHHPDGSVVEYRVACLCRKPWPGMLFRAARDLDLDLARSWLIGDILHDVEAGARAGCRTILLNNGNETEWQMSSLRIPDEIARDLPEAAGRILARDRVALAHPTRGLA